MPLITDEIFTKHQKEIYDHIMRGSLRFDFGFSDKPIVLKTIPMILVDGIWEMKKS